jgi:hypothetical protein
LRNYPFGYLLILFFIVGSLELAFGQRPVDCNQQTAIVRLYVNKPKLDFLKSALNNGKTKKDSLYYEKEIKKHLEDRLLYTQKVIYHFRQNYVPTQMIKFIPDSLWIDFIKNIERPYFLNEQGTLSSEIIQPNSLNYYVIARGNFDEDFIAIDQRGNRLLPPFPSKIRHSILSKLNTVVGDGMKTSIERYCKQINKYCNQ